MLRDANNPLLKLEAKISRPSRCRCFIRLRIKRASWNRLAYTVKRLNNYYKSFFSYLRTLTTWHCPHSPAAATAIDTFCPPGPQQQTCNSGFAAMDLCWDRQMDGHRTVSQTCSTYYAGSAKNSNISRKMKNTQFLQLWKLTINWWNIGCSVAGEWLAC